MMIVQFGALSDAFDSYSYKTERIRNLFER